MSEAVAEESVVVKSEVSNDEVASVSNAINTENFVSVNIDSLILGRAIKFPIYDRAGLLLLSEGSVITPNFRRILREREVTRVQMHSDDADVVSSTRAVSRLSNSSRKKNRDLNISKQLRKSVDNGLQFVTNYGDKVQDAILDHGVSSYAKEKLQELDKKNKKQCEQLSNLMGTALSSDKLDGDIFRDAAVNFMEGMCEDFDCVNSLALNMQIDDELAQHCHRMSVLGMSIAVEMGLNDENVCRIGVTGMLHDWGMLKIPEHIRKPKKPLTEAERLEMQKHVMYSVDLLEKMTGLPTLVPLVSYQIHEQMNGNGYPRGRTANNIHLFARILHVAHCYVDLTTPTAYRSALTPYDATLQLFRFAKNGILDSTVLRALLRAQSLFPVGSLVMLSSGSMAKVIRANGDRFAEPIVQLVQDDQGKDLQESEETILNLSETDCKVVQAMPIFHNAEPIPAPHFLKAGRSKKKQPKKTRSSR